MGVKSGVMQSMDCASLCNHNNSTENRMHLRNKLISKSTSHSHVPTLAY